jgi:nucleoside-diphosphate-sugar epimerase
MTRSVVFGASGAIGRFLLPRLLARGDEVFAVSRVSRHGVNPHLHWRVGDLCADVAGVPVVDAIFSLGPLDEFAAWLERTQLAGRPRLVAIGSLSVISKRDSVDAAERALAARLAQAETRLARAATAHGCAWTILRPTLIWGAGLDRSLTPFARFASRWHVLPRPAGARGLRQPVHADDLAALCIAARERSAAADRRYDVGGGERLDFGEMLSRIRLSLPAFTLSLPLPVPLLRLAAARVPAWRRFRAPLARLDADLVADHEAAVADLGWAPRGFRPEAACWQPRPLP